MGTVLEMRLERADDSVSQQLDQTRRDAKNLQFVEPS